MKKSEIRVGGVYVAKVSGKLTNVRVDYIKSRHDLYGRPSGYANYDVTNLTTGRKTTFRSAAKFRQRVDLVPSSNLRPDGSVINPAEPRTAIALEIADQQEV